MAVALAESSGNPAAVGDMNIPNVAAAGGSVGLWQINKAAHPEFAGQDLTDPQINAWLDSHGNEVADKCQYSYGKPVTLSNGSIWRVQKLWSNADGMCEQSIPLP